MIPSPSPNPAGHLHSFAAGTLHAGGYDLAEAERFADGLVTYAQLLSAWGERINLTGLRSVDTILDELVMGAALLGRSLPSFRTLVDIGSGAGLPGLPLALVFPERQFLLVEPRERRHHFLRHAVRTLTLRNVRTLRARAEQAAPEPHDVAIAQAVGVPAKVIPMLRRWVRPGGCIAIPTREDGFECGEVSAAMETRLVPYGIAGAARHALWLAWPSPDPAG